MTTILTIEKLQEITAISQSLGNHVDQILPFIEYAEATHLEEDILGSALYSDIINDIEMGVLSGHNKTLVEKYLYKTSAWYSFFEASPFLIARMEAKGLTMKFSENSQVLSTEQQAIYKQAIYDKAIHCRNLTLKYLQKNIDKFSLWRLDNCNANGGWDNSSGIYL